MAVTAPATHRVTGPPDSAREFRPHIEGLRALAIVPVVLFHAHQFLDPAAQDGWLGRVTGLVPGGYLGVDVFFVISGFLITGLLVREVESTGRLSFAGFYARRVRRILPAATVTLLVTLLVALLVLPGDRAAATAQDVLWAGLFNSDVHFATSGVDYMGVATTPSPVLHFWSLNDEEKFYLVWPLLLFAASLAARVFARRRLRPVLFGALVLLAVPSLLWSQHLVATGANAAYFAAPSRAFELAFGGLLAIAWPEVSRLPGLLRDAGAVLGAVLVGWAIATYSTATAFPGLNALPAVVGTMLVIAGTERGPASRLLSLRLPRWFGRISYSLYLWHWPVLVLATAAVAAGVLDVAQTAVCVVAAVLISWLSYRFVEQPPQRTGFLRRPWRALVVGAALIAVTTFSALGVENVAQAKELASFSAAREGIQPVAVVDRSLLYIGDSITSRGVAPLRVALAAAGWNFRIDALGGRPILSGARSSWRPLCLGQPSCGADLVLKADPGAGTVVIALGSNSFNLREVPIPTDNPGVSAFKPVNDAEGHYVVEGQDSAAQFAAEVDRIMAMVPATTQVYWVGIWLDDSHWANIHWRTDNAAIKSATARYSNAHFIDYASYVETHAVPYQPDGSHPTPAGMLLRARWIVSQLK